MAHQPQVLRRYCWNRCAPARRAIVSNVSSTKPVGYIALDDVGRVTGRQEGSYALYLLPASRYRLRSSECKKRDSPITFIQYETVRQTTRASDGEASNFFQGEHVKVEIEGQGSIAAQRFRKHLSKSIGD